VRFSWLLKFDGTENEDAYPDSGTSSDAWLKLQTNVVPLEAFPVADYFAINVARLNAVAGIQFLNPRCITLEGDAFNSKRSVGLPVSLAALGTLALAIMLIYRLSSTQL
jgi:hypothetical protein